MELPTKNLLSMKNAARYIDRYHKFRADFSNDKLILVDSCQFSIEAMENYICYVKSLSSLKGVEVSGMRVVHGIYPSDIEESEKRNQQTVLFIPTYKNRKGEHEAFDPLYINNGIPEKLSQLLKNAEEDELDRDPKNNYPKSKNIMLSLTGSAESSSFLNFGKMGKPPVVPEE